MKNSSANITGRTAILVANRLRREIAAGAYTPGAYLPPLRLLATKLGVSAVTAIRAIKILEKEGLTAAKPRQGYLVLQKGTTEDLPRPAKVFGFVTVGPALRLWNETHKALLAGFQAVAGNGGPEVRALALNDSPAQLVEALLRAGIAGVALDSTDLAYIQAVRDAGIPIVLVDAFTHEVDVDGIVQDNFHGGFLAGAHLAKQGHRQVAWLSNKDASLHYHERLGGAIAGLRSEGASLSDPFVIEVPPPGAPPPSNTETESALSAAHTLLTKQGRPKAILALWHDLSNAILTVACDLHLVLHRDFELITWGIEENRATSYRARFRPGTLPPMVCWSARRMAELAITRLTQLTDGATHPPTRLGVPTRLLLDDEHV